MNVNRNPAYADLRDVRAMLADKHKKLVIRGDSIRTHSWTVVLLREGHCIR